MNDIIVAGETKLGRQIRVSSTGGYEVQPSGDNMWMQCDSIEEAHAIADGPGTPPDIDYAMRMLDLCLDHHLVRDGADAAIVRTWLRRARLSLVS